MDNRKQLEKLRIPFLENQISKLPKPTRQQTEEVKANFRAGIRCQICGGWHHPNVIHLDYVGHAALTDRLLDADPLWSWVPLSTDQNGLPQFDNIGGLWIELTICGVTRLGYGDAQGKTGPNAIKEAIGDALRNSAMRFGAALDLWHKGDLHIEDNAKENETEITIPENDADILKQFKDCKTINEALDAWKDCGKLDMYKSVFGHKYTELKNKEESENE